MLQNELTNLRQVIESGGDTLTIDAALAPVAAAREPQTIAPLLLMLRDDDDDYGMWSVVHAAEQFEHAIYVSHFLAALPDLAVASSKWASILMMRVLNSDGARTELVRQLRSAALAVRNAATRVCEAINSSDPLFLAKTTAILVAAG